MNTIVIKQFKIDYDFIIKNYLDKHLWQKVWTLLVYREHEFTINLYRIDTKNNAIEFEIKRKGTWRSEIISYYIDNTPLKVFIKEINGALFRTMVKYEEDCIEDTPGYRRIRDARDEERSMLKDIAIQFLDSNGISNDDVRDAYIDRYIDRNETTYRKLNEYKDTYKFNLLSDMFLVYCKITNDQVRLQNVKAAVKDKRRLAVIEAEVETFMQEMNTDAYVDEMESCLEAL